MIKRPPKPAPKPIKWQAFYHETNRTVEVLGGYPWEDGGYYYPDITPYHQPVGMAQRSGPRSVVMAMSENPAGAIWDMSVFASMAPKEGE